MNAVLNAYFSAAGWVSEQFNLHTIDDTWTRLLLALSLSIILIAVAAIVLHVLPRRIASLVRTAGRSLSYGATTDGARKLEQHSGVLFRALVRFSLIWGRTSYGYPDRQPARLPPVDASRRSHMTRKFARRFALLVGWFAAAVRFIGLALTTAFGASVLILGCSLAFPEDSRAAVDRALQAIASTARNLASINLSPLALITTLSGSIAVIAVAAKFMRSDRMTAKRMYRQQRDIEAIGLLREFLPMVRELADAVDEEADHHVNARNLEYANIKLWHREMTSTGQRSFAGHESKQLHLHCTAACLESIDIPSGPKKYSTTLSAAISTFEDQAGLCRRMNDRRSAFAHLLSMRSWQGYTEFFPSSVLAHDWKVRDCLPVPGGDIWTRRRIDWQHQQLRRLPADERERLTDGHALTSIAIPPSTWRARELSRDVWRMLESSRHMNQLADFGPQLLGTSRMETVLAKMSAS